MKIAFVCPYFGNLPKYFQLWLNSCKRNKDIKWYVLTNDRTNFDVPQNVEMIYTRLEEIKEKIEIKLGFKVPLENPYKLCDYKPLYGFIFSDILKEHEFWGHCDLDCMFGDIRKFVTDTILRKYEKILFLGHMVIYVNTKEVNERFKLPLKNRPSYKEIFQNNQNFAFDEINNEIDFNINKIYEEYNFPVFKETIYADISCMSYSFRLNSYDENYKKIKGEKLNQIFTWEDGKVYSNYLENNRIQKREYAYVHFQKREMKIQINNLEEIEKCIIAPNVFLPLITELNVKEIKDLSKDKVFYSEYFKQKLKALKLKVEKKNG